jgi:hypothetical protein
MGFYADQDSLDEQFSQRRIDGTDILTRYDSTDEMDKSVQRQMAGEPPIKLKEDL